ncbi:MAG: hypothetical protein NT167_22515 [Verrucomicrobia bacterium]|nr:hypothetical protein [Verrucomicrobiota bacterium]
MTAQWLGAGAVLLPILALLFSKKLAAAWLPPTCLVSLVCLAAAGLLEGAPTFLMILGATAALASWDLMNLDRSMAGSASSETVRRFEKRHALSLAIALGLGLLMATSGKLFSLQIPFALLILLVLFDLFSLDRVSRYLGNRNARG